MPNPIEAYRGAIPEEAVVGGPGFVAVGRSSPCCADVSYEDDGWEVAIWTSTDGVEWELVPDLASFGRAGLTAIDARDDGLLVAVGYDVVAPDASAEALFEMQGTAWSSANGIDWLAARPPAGHYEDVISTPGGWLIGGDAHGRPAIFTSSDLNHWSTHTFDGYGRVTTLAASADGRVLASGCADDDPGGHCPPMTWLSTGGEWEPVDIAASSVYTAAVWQEAFVAVGKTADDVPRGMSWLLTDEGRWESAGAPDGIGDVLALVRDGDRLIAAGSSENLFESSDGLRWSAYAQRQLPEGAVDAGVVHFLLPTERGLVALGEIFVVGAVPYAWTPPE